MSANQKESTQSSESMNIKVNFRIGRMPSVYAHHMLIQPGEQEVVISFFEITPPFVLGDDEDQLKHLQETGVMADCVARITVSRGRFAGFANAMQEIANAIQQMPDSDSSELQEENANAQRSGDNQENK